MARQVTIPTGAPMEWLSMGPASRLVGVDPDSLRRRLHSRVPATILIALGGLIPAITSGANRFGATNGFFAGELLGVLFLFAGFLVSVEVFREFRVPFTRIVVRSRRVEG